MLTIQLPNETWNRRFLEFLMIFDIRMENWPSLGRDCGKQINNISHCSPFGVCTYNIELHLHCWSNNISIIFFTVVRKCVLIFFVLAYWGSCIHKSLEFKLGEKNNRLVCERKLFDEFAPIYDHFLDLMSSGSAKLQKIFTVFEKPVILVQLLITKNLWASESLYTSKNL